jgi:ATP/maltotriose-dependent transcriptional regulator MalT
MERARFGRQAELARISSFLDAIRTGPEALVLGGEAGIGKSALWLDTLEQARARSYRALSSRPTESEAKLSFAALGDLLDGVVDEALDALPSPQRSALEVALLRAEADASPPDRRTLSSAFHGALIALATAGPLLLAIDDAHWLDLPSARVLEFAIRRLHDVPIGIFITARGVDSGPLPLGLDRALPGERIHRLLVGPITQEATRDLLHSELSTRLPRSVLLQIHGTAAGNPFLALELGRALLRRGIEREPGTSLAVPSTLIDLVADRLSGLSDPVRQVLLVTAAASQPTASLVARAIGGTDADHEIEAALDDGVIEESAGRIRPAHPLLATVQYSVSSAHERREAHRRLAAVVVDQEERARHLALSADRPDEGVAAELEAASLQASGRGAPDAAAELADLARELTPADHAEARIHRTIHAGQFAFEAGELGKAAACLEEAVAATSSGPLRAEALLFLARVRYHSHDARAALALAEQALEEVGEDHQLKPHIQLELAGAAEAVGDRARARVHAGEAVVLAEAEGDDASLAEALTLIGFHDFLAGEGDARSAMSRALELEGAAVSVRPLRSPTFRQACVAMWMDELDAARQTFVDLAKRCREGGDEGSLAVILFMLAQVECSAGNWSDAGAYADESCEITAWTGHLPYRAVALSARALVEARLGRAESARATATEGLQLAERSGLVQATQFNLAALGFLELSLDNPKETNEILWPFAEGVLAAGVSEPGVLRFMPDEIEALIAIGEADTARSILEPFAALAEKLHRSWALATSERGWGLLNASIGNLPDALAAFDRALEHHSMLDEPFELGRTLLAQGQALRRLKKWRPARGSLGRSLEIFERLGAALWADKATTEMARIGGRSPGPDDLSPTEQEVAELVGSGLTNREVAHALFLSVSTVEANLRRIYRKLGVRSRTELSRRLSER